MRRGASPAGTLLRFLRRRGRELGALLILTHDHPDPDAVASALALGHLVRVICRRPCRIAHGGIIGRVENQTMVRVLRIPVRRLRRKSDLRGFRSVALVDTQPGFGNNPFPRDGVATLVVDHHPPVRPDGALCSVVDPSAGATSVILAEALLRAGCSIPTGLATALVYGIVSETQELSRQTRDRDIAVYRKLFPLSDIRSLALIQNPQRPDKFFQTLKSSLDNAFMAGPRSPLPGGRPRAGALIGAHLGEVPTPDLVSQTADFLLTCEGMRWALCTGRYQGRLHVSVRATRPGLHAGRLLQRVLGEKERAGGHWSMAGGSLALPPLGTGYRTGTRYRERMWRKAQRQITRRLLRRIGLGRSRLRFPFRT
ncbi:MAG: DHH family phosphoesterase [Candidatus Omnitrophica bacterium]|nr:DHH family phosphoesterase [Candidatus Omnitrophota bacterium]